MKIPDTSPTYKYGIVVDSGSSGSRVQIYRWEDPNYTKKHGKEEDILTSPPKIVQEKDWTLKTSPGISSFDEKNKVKDIWPKHFAKLMKYAEDIIPLDKHSDTPVFVLATAGMRLLSPAKKKMILKETCSALQKNTNFYLPNCKNFIQIIDGETEGIYGWLSLNYLMGQFDKYKGSDKVHKSIGFMDMGGASTQIAFVPSSKEEIKKHEEDLSRVLLRNINGENQKWNVFSETWLGFGANESRKRYLNQLINLSISNPNLGVEINDPCLPKDAEVSYEHDKVMYTIKGIGNYEMCLKTIYPLLMKNVPCKDEPCLFNGIHGPQLNFKDDKFVGISEYWYTANDIFQSGGEYNYLSFNEKVRGYCESNWKDILANSEKGDYSNLNPDTFLKDACFKASWVINILHEGFGLPRLGLEVPKEEADEKEAEEIEKIDKVHVPFKSADSVNGGELSWTLGKILLFASSQIESTTDNNDLQIGIYPSEISGKDFVTGSGILADNYDRDKDEDDLEGNVIYSIIFIFLLFFFVYHFGKKHMKWAHGFRRLEFLSPQSVRLYINEMGSKLPGVNKYFSNDAIYLDFLNQNDININLEEGMISSATTPKNMPDLSVLRTRSTMNLSEIDKSEDRKDSDSIHSGPTNFMNKPFSLPKKNQGNLFQYGDNRSWDSLVRTSSNSSIQRAKNFERSK